MPTLTATPPSLNPHDSCVAAVKAGEWFIVQVRPRGEKSLAFRLLDRDASYYLPLRKETKRYGTNWHEMQLPLYPGYVFVAGDEYTEAWVRDCPESQHIAHEPRQRALIQELTNTEIVLFAKPDFGRDSIIDVVHQGGTVNVRVISGKFEGVIGKVIRTIDRKKRLIVGVEKCGYDSVEVDEADLEILD